MQDTIAILKEKFNIIGTVYLSDFFNAAGKKSLYASLESFYLPKYNDSDRILVIQDCADWYEYADMPGQALCYIQQCVSKIDISNYFVLVVSGNKNIQHELEQVQSLYSTDVCSMQYLIKGPEYSPMIRPKSDTFCVLPWMHLYVGPDGNVLPCCNADQQHPLGNIEKQSITSIMQSDPANKLRTNMLSGIRSKECKSCYLKEDQGLLSQRQEFNTNWSIDQQSAQAQIVEFQPRYLDIRLNNICNLKCRMCSGYFSSSIAQEERELFGRNRPVELLATKERKIAFNEILNYVPYAEKIYFAGGEPLLAPEHYAIIDRLIQVGNTNLSIAYNTNFTTLEFKDRSVLDLWKQFKSIQLGISIDAQGAVAEYIRHGCNWEKIEQNLDLVKQQCPHIKFVVASTVGFMNVVSLIELQQRWHQTNQMPIQNFHLSATVSPEHLSLPALPKHHKLRIHQLITKHIDWCTAQGADLVASQWQGVLNYMWSQDLSYHLAEFKRLTQSMDGYRKESFVGVLPEFQDLL
jgi:radical SAM protein with 4Fe4S-binding SPASM domain